MAPPGPPGPPGPPSPILQPVYGSLYGGDPTIPVTSNGIVDFTTSGPSSGTIPDPATNTITVLSTGVYNIEFGIAIHLAVAASTNNIAEIVQVIVNVNGVNDFTSLAVFIVNPIVDADLTIVSTQSKTIQRNLNAGDQVSLRFTSISGSGNGLSGYDFPSLVVTKIA
ncbi:hypothetical protein [Peribacillus simplex]|uniref:hypothetical protein n=1 Tax=Peribacillus simplex TaxID=1478 RepID=UPI003D27C0FE